MYVYSVNPGQDIREDVTDPTGRDDWDVNFSNSPGAVHSVPVWETILRVGKIICLIIITVC